MKPLKPAASTRTEYRPIGNRLKTIFARTVGHGGAGDIRAQIGDGDFGVGQYCAGVIRDGSDNVSGRDLRVRRDCAEQRKRRGQNSQKRCQLNARGNGTHFGKGVHFCLLWSGRTPR